MYISIDFHLELTKSGTILQSDKILKNDEEEKYYELKFFYERHLYQEYNFEEWINMNPLTDFGKLLVGKKNNNINIVTTKNREAAESILDYYNIHVSGIYTNGTAAECHNQTEDEFDKLSEIVSTIAIKKNKKFQLGLSNTNPRVCRERAKRTKQLKPNGFQITLPDWWPPTFEESKNFIMGMQEVVEDVYMILYNPPHAKVLLTLKEISLLKFSGFSTIVSTL